MGRLRELLQVEYRELAREYVEAVKGHFRGRLVSICFFGSVARSEASPESDLDALVVAEGLPRDIGSRFRETNPLHEAVRRSEPYKRLRSERRSAFISDLYLMPDEVESHPPILLDIADHGVIAYDRDDFLSGVLEDIRKRLKELGARKVVTGKGYYWVLKPNAKRDEVVEI